MCTARAVSVSIGQECLQGSAIPSFQSRLERVEMNTLLCFLAVLAALGANFEVSAFHAPSSRLNRVKSTRLDVSMSGNSLRAGSVVALITPMKEDMSIDYAAFVDLLKWHVVEGTDGAVILGTTGEATMINQEDRTEIIKTAVKTVAGAFPIIVGAGTIETDKVIAMCQNAKDCGADASLVITPYYIKPPQRALIKHFWRWQTQWTCRWCCTIAQEEQG